MAHWESRAGKWPRTEHLATLASVTGVSVDWLATGRGQPRVSREVQLDSIAAADAILVEDDLEMRLIRLLRLMPLRARISLLEISELLVGQASRKRGARSPLRGA